MIQNKFAFFCFFLTFLSAGYAEDIKYNLRRFDSNLYKKSYSGTLKYRMESESRSKKDLNIIYRKKNKKYEGYYKIGQPYVIFGKKYYPREDPNYKEIGMASWYGSDFHNKKTANGETYNMNDYTAAHRTLPLPCIVKVTNVENGKSIKVRVNDRGPFAKNRIIDVSKKVAKKLDFHEQGVTKVKVEYMKKDSEALLEEYGLK